MENKIIIKDDDTKNPRSLNWQCECGCKEQVVINFDRMWGDGDVVCVQCHKLLRSFDSG